MGLKLEFVGLCGAGKTTFLNNLASEIESDLNLMISYPIIPSRKNIIISFSRIFLFALISEPLIFIQFILRAESWWLIKKIAYRYATIAERADEDSILADSGILQPFISFEIEKNLSDVSVPIHCLLKGCRLPDVIINFHVSPTTAMKRYELRGLKGEGKIIRKNSDKYFFRARELQKKLLKYCKESKVYIVDIDSQHEFTEEYLKDKLQEIKKILIDEKTEHEKIL